MRLLTIIALSMTMSGVAIAQIPREAAPAGASEVNTQSQAPQPHDPLLDLPPLPHKRVTLIGGTVTKLDPIEDRLTVRAFGGRAIEVNFDVRTHVYLNGATVHETELKTGQRVYLDTLLNGDKVFAKSIRISTTQPTGEGRGQVLGYDSDKRILKVRDSLSSQPAAFQLLSDTTIRRGDQVGTVRDLEPGALVSLKFGPSTSKYATVREISIVAKPGSQFSFFGTVTFLDLSRRLIALNNNADNKNYQISMQAIPDSQARDFHEGDIVGISALFDGSHYVARTIEKVHNPNSRSH